MIVVLAYVGSAQPRPAESSVPDKQKSDIGTIHAKYEGGMFGYSDKESGTLKLDDANARIVFYGSKQKEFFSIPYNALLVVSPQSRSVTSNTGNVVRHIPLPGSVLGGLIKEKHRYLVLQFDDPDVDVKGIVSFKISNKATLDTLIRTLGEKAEMTSRGDAYYRPSKGNDEL